MTNVESALMEVKIVLNILIIEWGLWSMILREIFKEWSEKENKGHSYWQIVIRTITVRKVCRETIQDFKES